MPLPSFTIQETMDYLERQSNDPTVGITRPLLISTVESMTPGIAIDIGCGAFRESSYLASRGWMVHAVDEIPNVKKYLENKPTSIQDKIFFQCSKIENVKLKKSNLVVAYYSLPFVSNLDNLVKVVDKITESLHSGGLFIGSFFGLNDDWYITENDAKSERS